MSEGKQTCRFCWVCYRQKAGLRSLKSKEDYEVVPAATIWRSFAFIPQINEQAEFSLSLPQGGERAFMDSKDQRDGDRSCLAQHWESQDTTGFCSTAVACLLLKHTLLCLLM